MSSTTNEERREAAANLRKIHLGGASKDLIELMLSDAIGAWHENGISWDYITERLADLIEPARLTTIIRVMRGDENAAGDICCSCESCNGGWHWSKYDTALRFCPHCGARVTERAMDLRRKTKS